MGRILKVEENEMYMQDMNIIQKKIEEAIAFIPKRHELNYKKDIMLSKRLKEALQKAKTLSSKLKDRIRLN